VSWPCLRHRRDDQCRVLVGKCEGKCPLLTSVVGYEVITEIEWIVVERIWLGLVKTVRN